MNPALRSRTRISVVYHGKWVIRSRVRWSHYFRVLAARRGRG